MSDCSQVHPNKLLLRRQQPGENLQALFARIKGTAANKEVATNVSLFVLAAMEDRELSEELSLFDFKVLDSSKHMNTNHKFT